MWPFKIKQKIGVKELIDRIRKNKETFEIEGITLSGGEPLLQWRILIPFLQEIKKMELSVICFSGYTWEEINCAKFKLVLPLIDILVSGPFMQKEKGNLPLRGSNNQEIHFLTNRYDNSDIKEQSTEILIDTDGKITITGFPSKDILDFFSNY